MTSSKCARRVIFGIANLDAQLNFITKNIPIDGQQIELTGRNRKFSIT